LGEEEGIISSTFSLIGGWYILPPSFYLLTNQRIIVVLRTYGVGQEEVSLGLAFIESEDVR
jgi:hypothetical protein